ncbi:2514_t:CDS:2 [Paraglomus occultum]|uniref:2514_t:CDS:1 n=1 Tax=Paraglomus occultum TaxID=144539 RepID=A0A9N9H4T4_9GLOM|nr:2514_t:CDS:2 [Paraglomus occultum]
MSQNGGLDSMLDQAYHFLKETPEQITYNIRRYYKKTQRLLSMLKTG